MMYSLGMAQKHSDQFSKKEAQQRFEAALKGARLVSRNLGKVDTKPTKRKRKPGKK
jgi:hypothetical protein